MVEVVLLVEVVVYADSVHLHRGGGAAARKALGRQQSDFLFLLFLATPYLFSPLRQLLTLPHCQLQGLEMLWMVSNQWDIQKLNCDKETADIASGREGT